MARHQFGGALADWVYLEDDGDRPVLQGAVPLTFWDARESGAQHTDLTADLAGTVPLTSVVTSAGDDGYRIGVIPIFYGPDGVTEMWASADLGERGLIPANDLGPLVTGALQKSTVTTKGDVLVASSSAVIARLPVGANGTVLTADSAQTSGVRWASPGGGGGGVATTSDILWVAASDAPSQFSDAPYVCDGTADQVEIQTALNNVLGLRVGLSPGAFNLTAPVNMYGADDSAVPAAKYLQGSGMYATTLVLASGQTGAIFCGKVVTPYISDLAIEVVGNSHGIYANGSATGAANLRSFVGGAFERLSVLGPGSGNNTGWGMTLGSGIQYSVSDVQITGMTNGVRVLNESSTFHAQGARFNRVTVDLTGNSGIGFQVSSPSGGANQISFDTCHAVIASASTSTVGWSFTGAGATSGVRVRNSTCEVFDTAVSIAATAFDIDVDLSHANVPTGGTFATVAGYASRIRVGRLYIPVSATVTAVNETNAYALKPNMFDIDLYADTSSTVSATFTTGVLVRGVVDGAGTVTGLLKRQSATGRTFTFTKDPIATGAGGFKIYNDSGGDLTFKSHRISVTGTYTTGTIITDLNVNGTSIFPGGTNRATLAVNTSTTGRLTTGIAGVVWPAGSYITADVDGIGSAGTPSSLVYQVEVA